MSLFRCVSLIAATVAAHPSNLECDDPRFDDNSEIMYLKVQDNNKDPALEFTADTRSYEQGNPVQISIKANGNKYMKDYGAGGVFLALRVRPVLGSATDYGKITEIRGGLLPSKDGDGDCANQIYSDMRTPFTGTASAIWIPGQQTYGDVQLTLLFGNGVGPDHPMAHRFTNLTHPFLYRRILTLTGPKMPDTPSHLARRLADTRCVAPSNGFYNLPNSPVFVQKLRTFPEKSVTFPSNQCLDCREDQQKLCVSAKVVCPEEPGKLAVEYLFSSPDCSGEPTSQTKLSPRYTVCPGRGYHSPEHLDLERFVGKILRDEPHHFKSATEVREAIEEYRRVLLLMQKFPDAPVVPSKKVDLIWHNHILDTKTYRDDMQRMMGKYIHHAPAFGDNEDEEVKAEKESMLEDQKQMFERYVALFEDEPPASIWPTARRLGGVPGRLPDCCKASCVKPDCTGCVGCNAVDCGWLLESRLAGPPTKHVHPDHFAGYVPIPRSLAENLENADQSYLCSVQPLEGMTLSWTIDTDVIYMQQTLDVQVAETWHAVGFSDVMPYDMGFADFIVSFFSGNYTGVRDLYKYDRGNNYPCWDVLHQCSADGQTAGTMDLSDRYTIRSNGVSVSSWSRKLVTGDAKDSEITNQAKHVLFAYGGDDSFTFHGQLKSRNCKINFFTADPACDGLTQVV
jgi:hypothetical protein